jgi:DNA-directed RNA polymerase subunit M/transcription elongation factor TFIIS
VTDQGFATMTVECQHCKAKQKVLVVVRARSAQMGKQTIVCIKCKENFEVMVPDRIVGGPLPA